MATTGDQADGGVDTGQILVIALCLLGLLVAAFLAPVATPFGGMNGSGSGPGSGTGTETGGSGGQPTDSRQVEVSTASGGQATPVGGEGGGERYPRQRDENVNILNGTSPAPIPGDETGSVDGCGVVIDTRPVPGREITVSVYQDLRPAADTRVWFNDEFVGRTDQNGNITAQVPYERRLNVTVESPANDPCEFFRRPYEEDEERTQRVSDDTASDAASLTVGAGAGGPGDRQYAVRKQVRQTETPQAGENSTGEYEVYGTATVRIEGDPYPGTTVLVDAAIDDVPMRQANVTVDGQRVGQTNGSGQYALEVPDTDAIRVTVSRGAYNGTAIVDVLQLGLQYTASDPFIVPGERAEVTATVNDEPEPGVPISLDGERVGTTDENGTVGFEAPAQLSGSVTATTEYQTERLPVSGLYGATLWTSVAIVVLGVLSTGATARYRSRSSATRVAIGWTAVAALFVGFAVWEWVGLAAVGAVIALIALYRLRSAVRSGAVTTGSLLRSVVEACLRGVIHIVTGVEWLVDLTVRSLRRFAGWLGTLPRSLSGLARRLGAWLRGMPGRVIGYVRQISGRRVAVVVGIVALLAGATYYGGVYGFLGAGALVVLALAAWWYRSQSAEETDSETSSTGTSTGTSTTIPASNSIPSLRELWRRLARWVLPGTWRTRTPAEISQAAIDKGLPRKPVEALADAFRDVEYGGESESGYREQAQAAYESLAEAREDDG